MGRLTRLIAVINGKREYTAVNFQRAPGGNKKDFINALGPYEDLGAVEYLSALVKARGEAGRTGCPACQKREVIAWDVCNDGIAIESDGALHMLSGGDWEAKINFCPMCGRKLTSAEAEAALGGGADG